MAEQLSLFPELELTSSQGALLASRSPSQDSDTECSKEAGREAPSPSSIPAWLKNCDHASSSGKTCLAFYPRTPDFRSTTSSIRWSSAGTLISPGEFLTVRACEATTSPAGSRSEGDASGSSVCGLSDILEEASPSLLGYYLSAKALTGIKRRAAKRGKALPALLATALDEMIAWWEARDSEKPDKHSEPKAKTDQADPAMSPSRHAELELEEIAEDAGMTPEKIKELLAQSEEVAGMTSAKSSPSAGSRGSAQETETSAAPSSRMDAASASTNSAEGGGSSPTLFAGMSHQWGSRDEFTKTGIVQSGCEAQIVVMDKEAYNAGVNQTGGLGIKQDNASPNLRATGHAPAIAH